MITMGGFRGVVRRGFSVVYHLVGSKEGLASSSLYPPATLACFAQRRSWEAGRFILHMYIGQDTLTNAAQGRDKSRDTIEAPPARSVAPRSASLPIAGAVT
jgi:hypothetical protein